MTDLLGFLGAAPNSSSGGIVHLGFRAGPRNAPNRALEACFTEVLELSPEMLQIEFWNHILHRFWSWAQNAFKWSSGGIFYLGFGAGPRKAASCQSEVLVTCPHRSHESRESVEFCREKVVMLLQTSTRIFIRSSISHETLFICL